MLQNNNMVVKVLDFFDFPLRFFYSRISWIKSLLLPKIYCSDKKTIQKNFDLMKDILEKHNITLNNKICVEIGPGNSYLMAMNCLMCGAEKTILIEKFPRIFSKKMRSDYFRKELDIIIENYPKKALFFLENGKVKKDYLRFIVGDITDINHLPKVDFIYSLSVLEQIKKIDETIKSFRDILNPGGIMYHIIDLRDTFNFNRPFKFYRYSKRCWENYLTKEGINFTNRLRYDDYKKLFTKYRFEIVDEYIIRSKMKEKKVHKMFLGKELDISGIRVLLRRKND